MNLPQTLQANIDMFLQEDEARHPVEVVNPQTREQVVYLHVGEIELWVFKDASVASLLQLRDFVDRVISAR